MASIDAGSLDLERLARHFHERELEETPEEIGWVVHPDAEMKLLVNGLQVLRGRTAVVQMLADLHDSAIYSAKVEEMEWLDELTLLISANVRYAEAGGVSTSRIWWLDEFRDGLLHRVQAFKTEVDARAAYRPTVP